MWRGVRRKRFFSDKSCFAIAQIFRQALAFALSAFFHTTRQRLHGLEDTLHVFTWLDDDGLKGWDLGPIHVLDLLFMVERSTRPRLTIIEISFCEELE